MPEAAVPEHFLGKIAGPEYRPIRIHQSSNHIDLVAHKGISKCTTQLYRLITVKSSIATRHIAHACQHATAVVARWRCDSCAACHAAARTRPRSPSIDRRLDAGRVVVLGSATDRLELSHGPACAMASTIRWCAALKFILPIAGLRYSCPSTVDGHVPPANSVPPVRQRLSFAPLRRSQRPKTTRLPT